tara:strand:+ start:204 stop:1652 length:1449 start_codon:yes stop_codon:yes gene_type:complete
MKSAAVLPLALLFANLSALAISVTIPLLINADQYSIFALCWSVGQLVASIAFEWMRFGVMRYTVTQDAALAARRSGILWQGYALITATLIVVAIISLCWKLVLPFSGFIAVVAFYAACQGAFEGRQALARAHFENGYYSLAWVLRTFISLILSAVAAWLTGDGAASLFGLALSYPITLLLMNRSKRISLPGQAFDGEQIWFLAQHGFFAATATILSMLLASVLRGLSISVLGLLQAGGLVLAIDLAQKAISVVGLAVNVVMMQRSIRSVEFESERDQTRQVGNHIAVAAALILPSSLGFFLIQGPFVELFVQPEYLESYWSSIGWACFGGGMLAFRQFAIDSLFVAFGKTTGAIAGPLVTIVSCVTAIWAIGTLHESSARSIAVAFALSSAIGAIVAIFALGRVRKIVWPLADMVKMIVAAAIMTGAFYLLPHGTSIGSLAAILLVCGLSYCLSALALDLAGLRSLAELIYDRVAHKGRKVP